MDGTAKIEWEPGSDGELVGRDPRKMTVDELTELGHMCMSPLKALRLRCIDCCGGSAPEVRLCTAVDCPAWPFRMGKNPYRTKRVISEEQRAVMAARLALSRSSLTSLQGREREVASEGTHTTTPENETLA